MRRFVIGAACLALAGCGQSRDPQSVPTGDNPYGLAAAMSDGEPRRATEDLRTSDSTDPIDRSASGPQIAYTYTISYALDSEDIAPLQASHVALCRSLGPSRCVVVTTALARDYDGLEGGNAKLLVDARIAAEFGRRLDTAVAKADGQIASRQVSAEDITKQVVDTDARVRARQALADRLLALIRTSNGSVGDLVAAEKAHADVQEQLDAARGLQASLRRRVAMSEFAVDYRSTAASGRWAPVGQAVRGAGETLAGSLAGLLTFLVAAFPWALAIAALAWIARRRGWRLRLRRRAPAPPPA